MAKGVENGWSEGVIDGAHVTWKQKGVARQEERAAYTVFLKTNDK